MDKRIIYFFLVGLIALMTAVLSACDDGDDNSGGDGDTDTDSDSDGDGDADFPGNCACAARFTLDGKQVDICEKQALDCACVLKDSETLLSCRFFSKQNSDLISFANMDTSFVQQGEQYSSDVYRLSSLTMNVDSFSYLGSRFTMLFNQYMGSGGVASGTFTATVGDSAGTKSWKITDGQFHAPVIEQ
jgi:hypothetical protein